MTHLITPPPGLVRQWRDEALNLFPDDENPCSCDIDDARDENIATQAARWGADQELEACCEYIRTDGKWLANPEHLLAELRVTRRPNPPSLKERAIHALDRIDILWDTSEFSKETMEDINAIRRALESLPDSQD